MASDSPDFPFGIRDVVELLHLKVRRPGADSIYVDCPFCGDKRGRMNVNYVKDVWRCNHCGEHGGMLSLYARLNNTTTSDAYREICDALQTGETSWGYDGKEGYTAGAGDSAKESGIPAGKEGIAQSARASAQEIHQTYSLLLGMLSLLPKHRKHLNSEKRGLTDDQIAERGYKSTPPYFLCRKLTERLLKQGCTVQGVPGFYQDEKGNWTLNFNSRTAGILIPAVGIDGLIQGLQILLDVPLKDKDDPTDKPGAKYIWFSSSSKHMGVTSGSPVHFAGNPFVRVLYVTEGLIKADIAHLLMNRSFAATAGANNVKQLEPLFALLAQNGTELIVEAHDMDKYSNKTTAQGSSNIYLLAKKYGMECKRLTWDPNYKGVDDWQLALKRKEQREEEVRLLDFKQQYLLGLCEIGHIENKIQESHNAPEEKVEQAEYLGLSSEEYGVFLRDGEARLQQLLDVQRRCQRFKFYQLDFGAEQKPIPFAFKGMDALHKAGYEQPPAAEYRLVHDGELICPVNWVDAEILEYLKRHYSSGKSYNYQGRALASSDVVELYGQEKRRYFYVDADGFEPVRFSPFLARTEDTKREQVNKESEAKRDRSG